MIINNLTLPTTSEILDGFNTFELFPQTDFNITTIEEMQKIDSKALYDDWQSVGQFLIDATKKN